MIFLGMGPQAVSIESDPTQKIFYRKTESSKDILEGVTEVGLQVFNANRKAWQGAPPFKRKKS